MSVAAARSTADVTAKGKHETILLRANIQDQLARLLTQLEDLDELKDGKTHKRGAECALWQAERTERAERRMQPTMLPRHASATRPSPPPAIDDHSRCSLSACLPFAAEFTEAEYEETKAETLDQLREFQTFLERSLRGDMTLVDEFGAASLAIQAAVSEAFKTPEVIRMFAQKQPDQLRLRLAALQRDVKIKKIAHEQFQRQAGEILIALKKMGTEVRHDS